MFGCLIGHACVNEVQTMCQVFYPNEKFASVDEAAILTEDCAIAVKSERLRDVCRASLYVKGRWLGIHEETMPDNGEKALRAAVKRTVYAAFLAYTGVKPPWGNFTGIRPSKIVHDKWRLGFSNVQTARFMADNYHMDADKIALCFEVAEAERCILSRNDGHDFGLYVGVPFCPSRCLYCSFTSYPVGLYEHKLDIYLDSIEKEMAAVSRFGEGRTLESVYVGGGTPTSLSARQLERVLMGIRRHFNLKDALEFTVEAGRPDTVTADRLAVMKRCGVTRISVNPQTMNAETLRAIGRAHTPEQFLDAYRLARDMGFDNINIDIIVGLPGEDAADIERTMVQIAKLRPESLTVHTLAIKRASPLREELEKTGDTPSNAPVEAMIDVTKRGAKALGMKPYYMYRQKNMVGHFENIGYCKPGFACVYNVQMIGDRQTMLALGAGASTKLYSPDTNRLERIFNVKNVDEYIGRIDEMVERKRFIK